MQIMLADLIAHNTILKMQDDDFIFISRSGRNKKDVQAANSRRIKETMESDHLFIDNQLKNRQSETE